MSNVIPFRRRQTPHRFVFASEFTPCVDIDARETEGKAVFCYVVASSETNVSISKATFATFAEADEAAIQYARQHRYTYLSPTALLSGGAA